MTIKDLTAPIHDDSVVDKIYEIRNLKVMLDNDLAELYGVGTKVLNQAVKRNPERFTSDFMFQLKENEWKSLRSQIVTSKNERGGRTYLPNVFTEHGILMLSSVLKSSQAVQVNIRIVRIFSQLWSLVTEKSSLKLEIEAIKSKISNQDKNIELVFSYLDELTEKKNKPRKRIGYMPDEL